MLPEKNGASHDIVIHDKLSNTKQAVSPLLFSYPMYDEGQVPEAKLMLYDSKGTEYFTCFAKGANSHGRTELFVYLWEKLLESHFQRENEGKETIVMPVNLVKAIDYKSHFVFIAPPDFEVTQTSVVLNNKQFVYSKLIKCENYVL